MSAGVTCQDVTSAGGHLRPRCDPATYSAPPAAAPCAVDVSMETLASAWARAAADDDPGDDVSSHRQQRGPQPWETQHVPEFGSPGSHPIRTNQLSPHLHRNQQLQDSLLQREEEVVRLQQENHNLRQFLNCSSSFMRSLEEKVQKLSSGDRRNLKRSLQEDGTFRNHDARPSDPGAPRVSRRVCRNLVPSFSSQQDPALDLWVLRTLGLKDRDTIDPSAEPPCYGEPAPSSSSYRGLTSSSDRAAYPPRAPSCQNHLLSSRLAAGLQPPLDGDSTTSTNANTTADRAATRYQDANQLSYSPDQRAKLPTGMTSYPGSPVGYHQHTAPSPITQGFSRTLGAVGFTHPSGQPEFCTASPSDLAWGKDQSLSPYPPHRGLKRTHAVQRQNLSPIPNPCPVTRQNWTSKEVWETSSCCHTSIHPPGGAATIQLLTPPHTPRRDAVFTMSLSPSSSVKTHSFPQGQAFVRKDSLGCWNFTWIPKQEP